MALEKNASPVDMIAMASQVAAGGVVDEEKLAREKKFTFILKGKQTFDIWAETEEEATALFKEDEIFGHQKIIDVIEGEEGHNDVVRTHSQITDVASTRVIVENNPFEQAAKTAADRKDRVIVKMQMNEDGTSSEVVKKKKTTKKK